MSLADRLRIIRGHLTPAEVEERDALVRQRQQAHAQMEARQAAKGAEYRLYQDRMHQAAGIASVTLICHADMWRFIDRHCGARTSWRTPDQAEITNLPDGLRQVALSGPQLVTILFVMADLTRITGGILRVPIGVGPIARRVYDAVGAVVDLADPRSPHGTALPHIVIDARRSTSTDED
jgi:hypothetical protein